MKVYTEICSTAIRLYNLLNFRLA